MDAVRAPGLGTWNILRFNWHFYAAALGAAGLGLLLARGLGAPWSGFAYAGVLAVGWVVAGSLLASAYVYDFSPLYRLGWLGRLEPGAVVVNIHAGFDESSAQLQQLRPARLHVFDFYDPTAHTELAIRRARRLYPAFPGTQAVTTRHLPLPDASADLVLLMLAAHEIRQEAERAAFFREVRRITRPGGRVVVVEHLRDLPNVLAYTAGAFHFYSRRTWQRVFRAAGFAPAREAKLTPFVSVFTLRQDDSAA